MMKQKLLKLKKRYLMLLLGLIMAFAMLPAKTYAREMDQGDSQESLDEESYFTVTFRSEEGYIWGDEDEKESINQVEKGNTINDTPWVGDRPDYAFTGWKIEGDDTTLYVEDGDFENDIYSYVPKGNITFVAQWEEAYNITFHSEEGYIWGDEDDKERTYQVVKGKTINATPWVGDRPDYAFTGWKIEGDDTTLYVEDGDPENYIYSYVPEGDTTFEAQWEEAYNITFRSEEGYIWGDEDDKEETYQVGKGKTINDTPSVGNRPDYAFAGWKIEGDDTTLCVDDEDSENYIYSYVPEGDTIFVAQWEATYKITFRSEEGYIYGDKDRTEVTEGIYQVEKGKTIYYNPWVGNRPGYTFTGWKLIGDDTLYVVDEEFSENSIYNYVPEGDITFVAQWEKAYNITFYSEEGYIYGYEDETETTYQVGQGKTINYHRPWVGDRPGYVFTGWKIEGDDTLYTYEDSENSIHDYVPKSDTIFVAQWEKAESDENHEHTAGLPVKEHEVAATCTIAGSYDEVVYCTDCKEELSRTTKTVEALGHDWGEWIVTKAATETETGNRQRVCKHDASHIESEDIARLTSSKDDNEEQKSSEDPTTGGQTSSEQPTTEDQPSTQQPTVQKTLPSVGTATTISSGTYKVTASSAAKKEVTFTKAKSAKVTSVKVPDTVKIEGETYKVTAIGDNAVKNNKKLKSVTIGKNVTKIGKNAFSGCKNLNKITIKSAKLKSVDKNAIKGINKKATIKVPKKQLTTYKKLFKSKTGFKKTMKIKK